MALVVFDSIARVVSYDPALEVFEDGYEGFRVEEHADGKYFVVYNEVPENEAEPLIERRYILPDHTLGQFFKLHERYQNYTAREKFWFNLLVEVGEQMKGRRSEAVLRTITDAIYAVPKNYVHFVAMNMLKSRFYFLARERILGRDDKVDDLELVS